MYVFKKSLRLVDRGWIQEGESGMGQEYGAEWWRWSWGGVTLQPLSETQLTVRGRQAAETSCDQGPLLGSFGSMSRWFYLLPNQTVFGGSVGEEVGEFGI